MGALAITQDQVIKRIDELPSLPSIVYELNRVISDPMSSTSDVEKVMASDASMTTKVLKLANSAYYAIPGGVSSLSRAIAFIGFDTIHQLVLSTSIIDALVLKEPSSFNVNEFWIHSIGVGIASETIAKYVEHPTPADLFTCGLIHDMGKMAFCTVDPKAIANIADYALAKDISFVDAEIALNAPKHQEIGKILAERWFLPQQIQAVARYHHIWDPKQRGGISADLNQFVDIVSLANLLIHALKFGNSGHKKILGAPSALMTRLNVNAEDFKSLLRKIKSDLEKSRDFIRLIGGDTHG